MRPDSILSRGRSRQRAVERRLSAAAPKPVSRPAWSPFDAPEEDRLRAARLAPALAELGPVFAGFGRYLGSRADLLRPEACRLLGAIPDQTAAAAPGAVEARLRAELGAAAGELLAGLATEPFHSGLFVQSHRARRVDGRELEVSLVRPGIEERAAEDLPLLGLVGRCLPDVPIEEAVAGYRDELEDRLCDLSGQASGLAAFRFTAKAGRGLAVARVHRDLSTGRVLTVDHAAGEPMVCAGDPPALRGRLAGHLCRAWLEQLAAGPWLLLDADLRRLTDGRLWLAGGRFAIVTAERRRRFGAYLRAAAGEEPDRVLRLLESDLVPGPSADPVELRRRIRQASPLREMALDAPRETLASHLVVHWRLLRGCGYRPAPELEAFYRGSFWLDTTVEALGPVAGEPLRDAVETSEWHSAWSDLERALSVPWLTDTLGGWLEAAMLLPPRLDQALERQRDESPAPRTAPASGDGWRTAAGLGLALLAVMVLGVEMAALGGLLWVERAAALVVLVGGLLLFRLLWAAAARPRRGRRRIP